MPSAAEALEYAEGVEKLGIVGVLTLVGIFSVLVSIHLYRQSLACQKDREQHIADVGELRGEVKAVKARMEEREKAQAEGIARMESLHRGVLEIVSKLNDKSD